MEILTCPNEPCDEAILQERSSKEKSSKKVYQCVFCQRKYINGENGLVELESERVIPL